MRHEEDVKRARVVPGKYGILDSMLEIKEEEINTKDTPVLIRQGKTETQQLEDKY